MWNPFSKLTDAQARDAPVGRHAAGRNLWLVRENASDAHWEISLTLRGEGRDFRIGDYPELSLKQARAAAAAWRGLARSGLDPDQQQEAFRNAAARNLHQFYC